MGKSIIENLKDLQATDNEIPDREGIHANSRDYVLKPELYPYQIYTILKENFGPPNNYSFDDDKSQWQWLFSYNDFHIEIYDWKSYSTSIAIYHQGFSEEKSKKLAEAINDFLVKAANKKKSLIKTKIKESKHKILRNPFVTYYSTAENLLNLSVQLDKIELKNSEAKLIDALEDISEVFIYQIDFWDKKFDLYRSSFLMYMSSLEGFINILYELYLKKELRHERLYDKISREQVDVKLRLAPIYCDGFETKTIDHEDDRFKNYMRLVNLRNDYVHANLVKSLESYVIEEDEFTFIIENEEHSLIPTDINNLDFKHVEFAKKCVDDIIDLVFESMDVRTRREFKKIIFDEQIEVEDEDGILMPIN